MEKLDNFLKSVRGRKIQKQVKSAHAHQRQFLRYAGEFVDLEPGIRLAVDDKGKIVKESYGQPGPKEER